MNTHSHLHLIRLLAVPLFFAVVALLQWLWNITMPDVFNLKKITYWQTFRLMLISGILFGGLRYAAMPAHYRREVTAPNPPIDTSLRSIRDLPDAREKRP